MGQTLVLAGQTLTPAVLNRMYGSADSVPHTANTTGYLQVSSTYAIPASDPSPGTAYRLFTMGNGTWSTSATLQVSAGLAGIEIGQAPTFATTTFSNGASFCFEILVKLICVTNGSSGTWNSSININLTQTANAIVLATAADNSVSGVGCTASAVTQDTTVANAVGAYAKWSSVTGSPSLTCTGTIFEKVN